MLNDFNTIRLPHLSSRDFLNLSTATAIPRELEYSPSRSEVWSNSIIGCALRYIGGEYSSVGIAARDNWGFWTPLTLNKVRCDVVLTADLEENKWRFKLQYYGPVLDLHEQLKEYVLGTQAVERISIGRPTYSELLQHPLTTFAVTLYGDEATGLTLLPNR